MEEKDTFIFYLTPRRRLTQEDSDMQAYAYNCMHTTHTYAQSGLGYGHTLLPRHSPWGGMSAYSQ